MIQASQNLSFTTIVNEFKVQIYLFKKTKLKIKIRDIQNIKTMIVPEDYVSYIQNRPPKLLVKLENQQKLKNQIYFCQAILSYVGKFEFQDLSEECKLWFEDLQDLYQAFQEKQTIEISRRIFEGYQIRIKINVKINNIQFDKIIKLAIKDFQLNSIAQNTQFIRPKQQERFHIKRENSQLRMYKEYIPIGQKKLDLHLQNLSMIKQQQMSQNNKIQQSQPRRWKEKHKQSKESNQLKISAASAFIKCQHDSTILENDEFVQAKTDKRYPSNNNPEE